MNYYGLNELPETYKRYKSFTDGFEGWLMTTAKQRGLEIAAQAEAAAKAAGTKQKKNGKSKSHQIHWKDIKAVAQAVAESGMPSDDTSGLTDLNDAIRLRKEVTEHYRQQQKSDEEHPYFITILTDVRTMFNEWIFPSSKPSEQSNAHKPPLDTKKASFHQQWAVIFGLSNDTDDCDDSDDDTDADANKQAESDRPEAGPGSDNRSTPHNVTEAVPQASKTELELDRDFEVLCFLYDLYLLRRRVKQIWSDWVQRKIGTMTAAIVSDLALAQVQKWVIKLVEDLDDDGNNQKILGIVEGLLNLVPENQRELTLPADKSELPVYPRDLLCCDGIRYMRSFSLLESEDVGATQGSQPVDAFRLQFLLHFRSIGTNELVVSDRFTESFGSPEARSRVWLPFGFQILLDIQELLLITGSMEEVSSDMFNHSKDMVEIMKAHIDYEDELWNKGEKPDYMSVGDTKYSNQFLPILQSLRHYLLKLSKDDSQEVSGLLNITFFAAHPILCGLTMWDFHRTYHSAARIKVQWFTVALAHLHNACRQLGGLASPWPDLEFIIQSQGQARIYVGGPPTDPNVFFQRMCLALCASPRGIAKDSRKARQLNPATKQKRGLASYTPLEDRIREYYSTKSGSKRSLQLHNIFALLMSDLREATVKGSEESSGAEFPQLAQVKEKACIIFATIAKKRARRTNNKKTRKKNRLKIPDFSNRESDYDQGLNHATSQLADHELYANFDHLAFFRRAYTMLTRIRTEVLWDGSQALITLDASQEPPRDCQLLYDLLFDLAPPQNKNDKARASRYASSMEKLKKISEIMQEFIGEQGDLETKNAEEQLKQRTEHRTNSSGRNPLVGLTKDAIAEDTVARHDPPTLGNNLKSAGDADLMPLFELEQSGTDIPKSPKLFIFGKNEESAFDFEYALVDRSDIDIIDETQDEALKPTDVESHEPEDSAIRSEVESESKDTVTKAEAESALSNAVARPVTASPPKSPEPELGLNIDPPRDKICNSILGEGHSAYQGEAVATIKGKPSATHICIMSPTPFQALGDQEFHGGYAKWSMPDVETESRTPAEVLGPKAIEVEAPPFHYPSVLLEPLPVQHKPSNSWSFWKPISHAEVLPQNTDL
ncbi:uncharacterized protein N0V89_012296 [Didymosphaeria variabile]|uniref:DUF6604 domain-containing protein n=1 Tax=Didymosphaeria variabile TaxID=1932322 RepID=A0A9W8X8W5_9PLEO|nr:uncharacterized protein N0V89_012296 [Didymosphaeria variabile]KAJ4344552.1 hypothetical protein N0V89_012296 [Didymosphaeria variabile]